MAELISEPRVQFERLPSPKFGIVPGSLTKTVFFGTSKTTKTTKNEELTRSATVDGFELLSKKDVASVTSIFDENGVVYFETTDFTLDDDNSPTLFGKINWAPTGVGTNEPAAGVKYYVTYEVNKDLTTPTIFEIDTVDQAYDEFGDDSLSTNRLSLAARTYFANGAVRGFFMQMAGTTNTDIDTALAALTTEKFDILVPMFGATTTNSVISKLKSHVFQQSQTSQGNQRIAMLSTPTGTTITDYKTMAAAAGSLIGDNHAGERLVLTAPPSVFIDVDDVSTELDGTFANAAIAGFLSDPDNDVAVPTTRKELFGINDVGVTYTRVQANDLTANGVLVVEKKGLIVRVRHGITTDTTNLNSSELSVVRISDYIGNLLVQVLEQLYIGTKIDSTALASIRTTIETVLNSLIQKVIIVKFADLSVSQNVDNPVVIDVKLKIMPVFPLNLIDITFAFDVF